MNFFRELLFVGALALSACAGAEDVDLPLVDGGAAERSYVEFSAGVPTRVVNDMWERDDEVGIFVNNDKTHKHYKIDHVLSGAMSAVTLQDNILFSDVASNYYAYYPYATSNLAENLLSVDVRNQERPSDYELMWSSAEGVAASTVEFDFAYQYVKVNMEVTTSSDRDLTDMTVVMNGVATSAKFDLKQGQFVGRTVGKIELPVEVNDNLRSAHIESVLIPMDDISSVRFDFKVGERSFSYTPKSENGAWESGVEYNYDIMYDDGMLAIPVDSVVMNVYNIETYMGESPRLEYRVYPVDSPAAKDVVIDFSNAGVVSLNETTGVLTPLKSGETTATISTRMYPDVNAKCIVRVADGVRQAAVFDYLYSDMSYSQTLNPAKTVVGVIYSLAADKQSGYAVSIDERSLSWGPAATEKATDANNGRANMLKIQNLQPVFDTYAAMAWCYNKNAEPTFKYTSDMKNVWYMPSKNELRTILTVVLINSGDRGAVINKKFTDAGGVGVALSSQYFSSSSNTNKDNPEYVQCKFENDKYIINAYGASATDARRVRAIINFQF